MPQEQRLFDITEHSESRGRDYDRNGNVLTSSAGAQGRMQVMPGTMTDPGFGVRPWNGRDMEDLARVGREYLLAMRDRYGGDMRLAWAAYNWGPGNVDRALANHGDNWLAHAPRETRNYVFQNMRMLNGDGPAPSSGSSGRRRAQGTGFNRETVISRLLDPNTWTAPASSASAEASPSSASSRSPSRQGSGRGGIMARLLNPETWTLSPE